MSENVNKRIAIGAAWMVGLKQVDRFIGLISTVILARLLVPEHFGLVVYAMTFIAIVELFFQFGFETVLIRDQDAGRESYDTAWTLEIIKGLVLATLFAVGAKPISLFFNEPQVEMTLYFLTAIPILKGLENIGIVDFQKKLDFHKEFVFKFSVRLTSAIITIILAYYMRDHWALIYGMIFNSSLAVLLSYIMSGYRPRLCLSAFSRIFGFSKWLLLQNVVSGMGERVPVLVIGRFFAAPVVAFYNMGYELSNLATGEIAAPIRRALFPGVASIANDEKRMVETIISALGVIAFIGLPVTIGVAVTAPIFVPLLLGDNWHDIIPIIQVLAINGVAMALYSNSHVVFYALDKPQITAFISGSRLALLTPIILLLVPDHGAIGAAWALSITNVIIVASEYVLFYRMVTVRVADILSVIWRSILSVAAMGSLTHYLMELDMAIAPLTKFILVVGAGVLTYGSSVLLLWLLAKRPSGAESYILNALKGIIDKRRKAHA